MGDHDVALPDHALDLDAQLGELRGETVDEGDKRIGAVGCMGVVLDVLRAEILLDGLLRLLGVESELVVLSHGLLVVLDVAHESCSPRSAPHIARRATSTASVACLQPGQSPVQRLHPLSERLVLV